ncbi:MAG: metallophosphoesterase [Clostridia bacterium]|nr:metallophosphoesterase [Clostridia bacterium]
MKKTFSVLLAALFLFAAAAPVFAADAPERLTFREDGTFTILHITDTQDDHHPSWEMLNLLKRSIEESDPDLIVFTGDVVEDSRVGDPGVDDEPMREGVCVYDAKREIVIDKTLANIETAVDAIFTVLEDSGVPYVIAQGNNDHKCGITNADWLAIYGKYAHNLTQDQSDDAQGRIDCRLPVYGADGSPVFNVWIMDSGKGGVNADQIDWYKRTSSELTAANGGEPTPAFAFQHIPTADVGNLFTECHAWEDGATAKGTKFYRLDPAIASGDNFYAYVPGTTTEEFAAWKECGDVIGAWFGHQHVEAFSGTVDGIELGLTYGMEFAKTGPYGYRVLTLHEDDITRYDNEVFTYSGSVKLGTDKIGKMDTAPKEYNSFTRFFAYIRNILKSMISIITSLF